jgi:hypothetical protein
VRRTFLLGNGLSLAFNADHYRLATLTGRVRERLAGMALPDRGTLLEELEAIAETLRPDLVDHRRETFEDIAGPVDRLANTLSEFGPLDRVATPEQRNVLHDLQVMLRALYRRVVGSVLELVMAHPEGEVGWAAVNEVAEYLVGVAVDQGDLDVFCLNYDSLLDSALLQARAGTYKGEFRLSDEFQGYEDQLIRIFPPDRQLVQVRAFPWRIGPYYPPVGAPLRLHHLHGAGTWMRFQGRIWKAADLDEIRGAGLFTAWAEGLGEVEPVVLLGDQKGTSVDRAPFNETYEAFISAVSRADEIVLAGFSFLDLPLNRTIATYRPPGSRIVVVNPHEDIDATARRALGLRREDPLLVVPERLPGGIRALG